MISEEELRQAYEGWTKHDLSLRKLAKTYGVPKSTLARRFDEIRKKEGTPATGDESSPIQEDPELQSLESEVEALKQRVARSERLIWLRNRKEQLNRRAIELEAELETSRLPAYVSTIIEEDYPELTSKIVRLCSTLGITEEEAIRDVFGGESYDELQDETFEDYVASHLREWISAKEDLVGEEWERAEQEKRAAEIKRRNELEEELKRMMPKLRCPLCPREGKITSYAIVSEEFGVEAYFRCGNCELFFRPKWVTDPFGRNEIELLPMPFAKVPN